MADFNVGDRVRLTGEIYEPTDDHSPGGTLGNKGDIVIIREARSRGVWPYRVSHPARTDGNTFSVGADEIEKETP